MLIPEMPTLFPKEVSETPCLFVSPAERFYGGSSEGEMFFFLAGFIRVPAAGRTCRSRRRGTPVRAEIPGAKCTAGLQGLEGYGMQAGDRLMLRENCSGQVGSPAVEAYTGPSRPSPNPSPEPQGFGDLPQESSRRDLLFIAST
eukprot:s338_g13.t1